MATAKDLTTTATAGARPGLTGIGSTELAALITAASEAIADHLGYQLHRRTGVVETCVGGGRRLFLKAGAIQSIASLVCYEDTWDTGDYALEDDIKGVIRSNARPFPFTGRRGPGVSEAPLFRDDTGDITVTLACGWITPGQVALDGSLTRDLPQVLEEACILALRGWVRSDPNITSQAVGDASIGYGAAGRQSLPLVVAGLLKRYRKHAR